MATCEGGYRGVWGGKCFAPLCPPRRESGDGPEKLTLERPLPCPGRRRAAVSRRRQGWPWMPLSEASGNGHLASTDVLWLPKGRQILRSPTPRLAGVGGSPPGARFPSSCSIP